MSRLAFPDLRTVAITPELAPALSALVGALAPVPWREFGRVPWRTSGESAGRSWRHHVRFGLDALPSLLHAQYAFLRESPAHEYLLRRLAARAGDRAAVVYRFLCLNESLEDRTLAQLIPPTLIADLESRHALVRDDGRLCPSVSFVPFDDHYYVVESRHVMDAPERYGISPAHIHLQTAMQIAFYRGLLAGRPRRRLLEMGCGTGLVALELRDIAAHREGADLSDRSVAFAAINRIIRRDEMARFYCSDLFAQADGTFDVIIFSPWQPSERYADVIARFVEEAPAHLTEDGVVLLWIGDGVLDAVASVLTAHGLSATFWIRSSYRDRSDHDGTAVVRRLGCLEIRREQRRPARPIVIAKDARYWISDLKQRYAGSRFSA